MEKCYPIGKVAELCNTPVKTLRYYDEIGLLTPQRRSEDSNYRYYSKHQMNTLLVIRRLRALNFNLKEVQALIADTSLDFMESMMAAKQTELRGEIQMLQAKHETIASLTERIRLGREISAGHHSEDPESRHRGDGEIQVEYIPEGTMLFARQIMKKYCNADVSLFRWIDILEQCTTQGMTSKSPVIVTFHDQVLGQFLMKDCDVEFGMLVWEGTMEAKPKNLRSWGGMLAATTYHIGKYSDIVKTHIAVLQWINTHGYEVAGPVSEQFVISPLEVDDEAYQIVQVIVPVKESSS